MCERGRCNATLLSMGFVVSSKQLATGATSPSKGRMGVWWGDPFGAPQGGGRGVGPGRSGGPGRGGWTPCGEAHQEDQRAISWRSMGGILRLGKGPLAEFKLAHSSDAPRPVHPTPCSFAPGPPLDTCSRRFGFCSALQSIPPSSPETCPPPEGRGPFALRKALEEKYETKTGPWT